MTDVSELIERLSDELKGLGGVTIGTMHQCRDALQQQATETAELNSCLIGCRNERAELQDRIETLEAALLEYGDHQPSCDFAPDRYTHDQLNQTCTCGFAAFQGVHR